MASDKSEDLPYNPYILMTPTGLWASASITRLRLYCMMCKRFFFTLRPSTTYASRSIVLIKMKRYIHLLPLFLTLSVMISACRKDQIVMPTEYEIIPGTIAPDSKIRGFYLLNEGNMGSNKCTLDFVDLLTGVYSRNFFAERNPSVIKELGDVGNDIGVYGSKLYVVVNCSHKVEVLDANTGISIGRIDIPNCRFIRFHRGKAYVSSYVGPVLIDPDAPRGAVIEIDTLSLQITRRVTVGYQPEEMEIVDDYMYVANSGGYRAPDYDNTLSVIQMIDFKQVRQIPVAINLHRVKKDNLKQLWVTSRGDNKSIPSRLFVLSQKRTGALMEVTDQLDIPCSNMAVKGDSLFYYATQWSDYTQSNTISYGIIDIRTHQRISESFITDGTEKEISIPYGIAVHPETGDIYITDARNYVSSGTLYCFSSDGKKRWSVRTGDIPAHIAFLPM